MPTSIVKLNFILIFLLLCVACSKHDQIEKDITAYKKRLQSFTGLSIDEQANKYDLSAPKKKSMQTEIEATFIALREFYAFKNCELNTLVAQRNTALGKTQLPSTRFVYEKTLIKQLSLCKEELIGNQTKPQEQLIQKLDLWLAIKQAQLPLVWSNMLTQSEESYLHLSQSRGFISGTGADNLFETRQAWRYLASALNEDIDSEILEQHLFNLEQSRLMAKIWQTQQLIIRELPLIDKLLSDFINQNTCQTLRQKEDIKIMQNIFTLFFAQKIQQVGGELNRYHYQLQPILHGIANHPNIAASLQSYLQFHLTQEHERYRKSMQNHISLWQEIFALCS